MQTLPPTAHPQQEGAQEAFTCGTILAQSRGSAALSTPISPIPESAQTLITCFLLSCPTIVLHAPGELTPVIAAPSSWVNVIVTPANWEANRPLTFTLHVKFPFPVKEILAKIKNNVAFSIQTLPFRLTWMYLLFALSKSPGSFYINH